VLDHDGGVVRLSEISTADGALDDPVVGLWMSTATGTVEGCRVWLRSSDAVVGVVLDGAVTARQNTGVVEGGESAFGIRALADAIGGFAGNVISTSAAGVCIADDSDTRDYMVGNAFWACDGGHYVGPDGAIMGRAGLDAVPAERAFGEHVVEDPRFRNSALGDFTPRSDSPLIDGYPLADSLPHDAVGAVRPQGGGVDIGGLEFPAETCGDGLRQPGEACDEDAPQCSADCGVEINPP
jgi:hypothetical protein